MVSPKLVRHLEEHWEAVAARWLYLLRSQSTMEASGLPAIEINDVCERLFKRLGQWLTTGPDSDLAHQFEEIGRRRYHEKIPLSEALRALQLFRQASMGYIREQGFFGSALDLYGEAELEHDLNRFFDLVMYHLARGYEQELSSSHDTMR